MFDRIDEFHEPSHDIDHRAPIVAMWFLAYPIFKLRPTLPVLLVGTAIGVIVGGMAWRVGLSRLSRRASDVATVVCFVIAMAGIAFTHESHAPSLLVAWVSILTAGITVAAYDPATGARRE